MVRKDVDDRARDARVVVDDLAVEQRKIEADVEQVRARRTRDTERMDSGAISNPKDLARMQDELASLQRRIGTLEDEELEIMERAEAAQAALRVLEEELAGLDDKIAELEAARTAKDDDLAAELARVEATRPAAAEGIADDLLALYDKLRATKGVGAAELRARECGGCRLTLDNAELAAIKAKPADEVVRCEECSRILVRTPESGL